MHNTNKIGKIIKAALVILLGSAISLPIATAATGDAAGVAKANCAVMNKSAIIPVGAMPITCEKLNINGITKMITIMLLAILVKTTAINKATITNTSGGKEVNGVNNFAIAAGTPVSGVFI